MYRTCTAILLTLCIVLNLSLSATAVAQYNAPTPILLTDREQGEQRTGHAFIWHDASAQATAQQALDAFYQGQFSSLQSQGSTGLKPGAFWTTFSLRNTTAQDLVYHLEYVDHQLIQLDAYQVTNERDLVQLVSLSMEQSFSTRPVDHPRLVVPVTIPSGQTMQFLWRMNSHEVGYVFPSFRIWTPAALDRAITVETALVGFLFGGFVLMSLFALVAGVATKKGSYYMYAIYAVSKIVVWATILGFTHQYWLMENFEWRYMSLSGAISVLCGFIFARMFLQTKVFTPKLDKVLLLTIANALVLLVSALLHLKLVAIVSITLALLLYPFITVVSWIRWRQGSAEAGIFTLAWTLLVVGLFIQACRDLGFVEHNFVNYYWPPVASFVEMIAIMAALGVQMVRLRDQKREAELAYKNHLEQTQLILEQTVEDRTRELNLQKQIAEREAQTDHLTGIANRRYFFNQLEAQLQASRERQFPVSFLLFDLDDFKQINDRYGHQSGDAALVEFARIIKANLRESDVFGRIGGEEFGLIINQPLDEAHELANRLRQAVSKMIVTTSKSSFALTVSIGLAAFQKNDSVEDLYTRVDKALYKAKSQGRNRVELI
ncbi:diguanylate cyclase [Alteromonas sp. ASW11-36]|uniref:diguanylate cyclase n=1 Tax=Alteromonas arenosi TaxID=3055817 RepID=A0ABT7T1Q5_9ALTE|nr:GGDEF domain-containing protein [Alteromonas sp. ASW11-36]MDM7861734.1 diguanylate cyclase [Alteromonas sp. ASW11-36]